MVLEKNRISTFFGARTSGALTWSTPIRFLKQTLGWHAREAAETLRGVARKAKRSPFWPGQALPGPQKGRLSPRRPRTRSIAMSFMSIAILLVLKMQAKENLSAF
jgi:hypothetical protein